MIKKIKNNDFIWNTLGNLFVSFLSMIFMIIVIRINNVNYGGIFNYGFTIAFIFYAIAQYGGRTLHVSDNNKVLNENDFIYSRIFTVVVSFIIFIVYILICSYTFEKFTIMTLLCIYKLIEAISDVIHGCYQKNNKLYIAGKSMFFRSLSACILFCISEILFKSVILSCGFLILNNILFLILDVYILKNKTNINLNNKFEFEKIKYYLKIAFFTFSFTFLLLFSFNIPRYFIDFLLTDKLQAIYGIIIMPASLISLMGHLIIQPYVLKITNLYNENKIKEINKILLRTMGFSALICIVLILGTIAFGIPVLEIVYSVKLDNQLINIIFIIIGSLLYLISIYLSTVLIIMRKTGFQLFIYVSTSIFGLFMAYYMINSFKLNGGILCYLSLMFIQMIMYIIYYIYQIRKVGNENVKNS